MKTQRKKKSLRKTRKCKKGGKSAIAILDMGRVKGVVRFVKQKGGVKVKYEIKGLKEGMHGFHIHEYGDMSEGCKSACSHFNPDKKQLSARQYSGLFSGPAFSPSRRSRENIFYGN